MRRAVCSLEELLREARGQVGGLMLCLLLHARCPLLTRLTPLANPLCHACFPQGGLTLGQVLHVSVQVLTGLQHLHRLGVLHRDLRTSNILVEGRDPLHVLVADFGVSHVLRQLEGAAGTVGYEGLRLLSAGEAVHGLGALGKWSCAPGPWPL
jgi:hypothetical protein